MAQAQADANRQEETIPEATIPSRYSFPIYDASLSRPKTAPAGEARRPRNRHDPRVVRFSELVQMTDRLSTQLHLLMEGVKRTQQQLSDLQTELEYYRPYGEKVSKLW